MKYMAWKMEEKDVYVLRDEKYIKKLCFSTILKEAEHILMNTHCLGYYNYELSNIISMPEKGAKSFWRDHKEGTIYEAGTWGGISLEEALEEIAEMIKEYRTKIAEMMNEAQLKKLLQRKKDLEIELQNLYKERGPWSTDVQARIDIDIMNAKLDVVNEKLEEAER